MADNALGAFLRERREAVRPEDVGLPPGGRRRTPGLRRAELATLAGISVDYLTRLEQGRDRHPSSQVLAALAGVLQLDGPDLILLQQLAALASSTELCPGITAPERELRPSLLGLLQRLEPTPAFVHNRLGDVVAHTDAWARLMGPLGALDDGHNLVRYVFGDPRATAAFPAWEQVADDVAEIVRDSNRRDDADLDHLVASLPEAGRAALVARLAGTPAARPGATVLRLAHPEVGELRLAREPLGVADSAVELVAFVPHDDATADALDQLLRPPGSLRAVPG